MVIRRDKASRASVTPLANPASARVDLSARRPRFFLRSLFQVWLTVGCASVAYSAPVSVGVPEVLGPLNILETQHPAAMITRESTVAALTRVVIDPNNLSAHQVRLMVADNYDVSSDHSVWKFRVRKSASFVNNEPVRATDVLYSLQRCKALGLAPWLKEVFVDKDLRSVDELIRLTVDTSDESVLPQIPELVSRCPVVEEASSKLFGDDLGNGTNLVGTGPYRLVENIKNRRIRLVKSGEASNSPGPSEIELRTFSDPAHGLTALRTGTLDMLFTENSDIIEKAKNDETLSLSKCSIYNVVLRRGFSFSCNGSFDPKSLRYVD